MPIRHYNLLFIIYIFDGLSKVCDGKAYIPGYYVDASMISTVNQGYFGWNGAILDAYVLAWPGLF